MSHKCSVSGVQTPALIVKDCPECGEELEFFSTDKKVTCDKCGTLVTRDMVQSDLNK